MEKHIILIVHVADRTASAGRMQEVLTEHGCLIRTRLGLHGAPDGSCSPSGLVVLELIDDEAGAEKLKKSLASVPGLETRKLVFPH